MARPKAQQEHPRVNYEGEKELRKIDEQIANTQKELDKINYETHQNAPMQETDDQTKISKKEVREFDAPVIKPTRSISGHDKFNPKFEKEHKKAWEYVKCIVEHYECIGSKVELWTKPFSGDPAHFWEIPVNKPIYLPRFLAKELKDNCSYIQLKMEGDPQKRTGSDATASYYGAIEVECKKQRIGCRSVSDEFSMSMNR